MENDGAEHSLVATSGSTHLGRSKRTGFWVPESMAAISRSLIVWIEHNQLTLPTRSNLELLKLYAIELANTWQFDVLVQFIRSVHGAIESVSYLSMEVALSWKLLVEKLQDEVGRYCSVEYGVRISFE